MNVKYTIPSTVKESDFTIRKQFDPLPDITPWQLAQIFLNVGLAEPVKFTEKSWGELPRAIAQHFRDPKEVTK